MTRVPPNRSEKQAISKNQTTISSWAKQVTRTPPNRSEKQVTRVPPNGSEKQAISKNQTTISTLRLSENQAIPQRQSAFVRLLPCRRQCKKTTLDYTGTACNVGTASAASECVDAKGWHLGLLV